MAASPADRSACTENGACTWVKVAIITRQILSAVSSGPEGGAGFLCSLDGDQAVDDVSALHQEAMHGLIDAVDFAPQITERGGRGTGGHEGRDYHPARQTDSAKHSAAGITRVGRAKKTLTDEVNGLPRPLPGAGSGFRLQRHRPQALV